jgi:hypothetical protein
VLLFQLQLLLFPAGLDGSEARPPHRCRLPLPAAFAPTSAPASAPATFPALVELRLQLLHVHGMPRGALQALLPQGVFACAFTFFRPHAASFFCRLCRRSCLPLRRP